MAASYDVGFRNVAGNYLTVEAFGDQLNAAGKKLQSKQKFTFSSDDGVVWTLKTHKGKFITSDHAAVKADSAHPGEQGLYSVTWHDGAIKLKNKAGKFLATNGNQVVVTDAGEEFHIVFTWLPQVCLWTQKHYVGINEAGEVVTKRETQFGSEVIFSLEESPVHGQIQLRASNGKYLECVGGSIKAAGDKSDKKTHLAIELHKGSIAIKSVAEGKYVSIVGTGMKVTGAAVTAKELFTISQSHPQIWLKAHNLKYVSNQGANLLCNRDKINLDDGDFEVFMLQPHGAKYALMNPVEQFWSAKTDGSLVIDTKTVSANELFDLEFHAGKLAIKTAHGKYVSAANIGGVNAKATSVTDKDTFEVGLDNRSILVLRTQDYSFLATQQGLIFSNKPNPESFSVQYKDSKYTLQNSEGKFWSLGPENRIAVAASPDHFIFEFIEGKIAIKASNGKYLKAESGTSGWLVASADKAEQDSLFAF